MVCCSFVVTGFEKLGAFLVVPGCKFMVLCRFPMSNWGYIWI